MAFGSITRKKAKKAFGMGIKAAQIKDFLITHAHYAVKDEVLPPNVRDQLDLWEAEKDRIVAQEATLIDFTDMSVGNRYARLFDHVYQYSMENGTHIWSSKEAKVIAIKPEAYKDTQDFYRSLAEA